MYAGYCNAYERLCTGAIPSCARANIDPLGYDVYLTTIELCKLYKQPVLTPALTITYA